MMRLIARLRRFARSRKGLAAVEFALIAPMMVTLLLGSVEVIDALGANRRTQNVAASLADVTARDTSVSAEELAGLWTGAEGLMFPNPTEDKLDVRITSVIINSATDARVVWSERNNEGFPELQPNDSVTEPVLPAGMMVAGSSVIITDTTYHYSPPLRFLFGGDVALTHTAVRRSRLVDPIPCTWTGCP